MIRVLVVDDEPPLLRTLALNLRTRDYDVTTASTAAESIAHVIRLPPDLMILDLGLPDRDGLDVIREVHEREPTLPIIVLSARASSRERSPRSTSAPSTKPFDMNELIARLRAVVRRASRDTPGQIVGVGDHEIT